MIKDNEDHPGLIVHVRSKTQIRHWFLVDDEDELDAVLKSHKLKPKDIIKGARCIYNWNRGQCIIKCTNCTITLCDFENTAKEKVAHSVIVTAQPNNIGW